MMSISKDPFSSENSMILLELIILICSDDSGQEQKKTFNSVINDGDY